VALLGVVLAWSVPVFAQSDDASTPALPIPLVANAPAVPVPPATMSRDDEGRATVRAVRATAPFRIDGVLDEPHYERVPAMSGFVQIDPTPGELATEQTEIWVSFDDDNVYVSARMHDSDMAHLVATEMRRDSSVIFQGNDIISFMLDPFYDRRNGLVFTINPIAGRSDSQVTNERQFIQDWNPVWSVKTGRFDGGWTMEAAIPFKSIRYGQGTAQVWGFNAMRTKRSKNERSLLTKVPPGRGDAALAQTSFAASMVGLDAPPARRALDIKPYATSSLTTNRTASPAVSNDPKAAGGVDLKYAVTQGLTADLTVNTDFAQVEADEQQANLTRFSLFFPEKREFFLENQGMFSFGGVQLTGNFNGMQNNDQVAPILFYSRRIGLNGTRVVPLRGGGRLTGRAGAYSIGVVSAQTGEEDEDLAAPARSTNYSVVRVKRDILRRSAVGLIATSVNPSGSGASNAVYGLDGTFAFFDNLAVNTYWARSDTPGRDGNDTSYRAQLLYDADRYGAQLERVTVGEDFNAGLGFVRRPHMQRTYGQLRFSPRPQGITRIRKFRYQTNAGVIEDNAGRLESRQLDGEFAVEFQNGDQFQTRYSSSYEFLAQPFQIATGVTLPVGAYDFETYRVGFNLGRQRRVSGNAAVEWGPFYNGRQTTVTLNQSRVSVMTALAIEPTYTLNKVELDQGRFTNNLVGSRVTYTMTPLMFASALVQYNSATGSVSTNARLRWEYQPGSELFVVYNEDRNTSALGVQGLSTRSIIVKVNRLFRY
jgi:uncharacterized protein DUF5916/cellulose/xylan binding protein with CBM9 domain